MLFDNQQSELEQAHKLAAGFGGRGLVLEWANGNRLSSGYDVTDWFKRERDAGERIHEVLQLPVGSRQ